jgi:hypothetical protein
MKEHLSEIIQRRHPLYEEMLPHWNFLEATYEGGRSWFKDNIFRYMKEGDEEYGDRVKRAYRFNHTKQVVDLVDKYLFKIPVLRNVEDAPDVIKEFYKRATTKGLDIDTFMRRVSNATSRFGRVWVAVDSALGGDFATELSSPLTVADRNAAGGAPYAYIIRPQDMLDMAYDDKCELIWALVREIGRDDEDPLTSSGLPEITYRLWTREGWYLLREVNASRGRAGSAASATGRMKTKVEVVDSGNHYLGVVPLIQADHTLSEENYQSDGLIDDVAYLDRANANYLSNLDAIIQDQTFSQLTIPAQGLLAGETGETELVKMGTKRIFTYNGEGGGKPEYISPDPRQASMILAAIGKIINEIYHSVGLSAERTKDDNGGGIDNASGVAKAYDFERVNSLLAAKSSTLQVIESRITNLVLLWEGQEDKIPETPLAKYPEKFDTRSLYDEFEIADKLKLLAAPDLVRRKQMKTVNEKLFPAASAKETTELDAALKDWPPEIIEPTPGGAKTDAGAAKAAGTPKTAKKLAG